jgi:hypothetical protein
VERLHDAAIKPKRANRGLRESTGKNEKVKGQAASAIL